MVCVQTSRPRLLGDRQEAETDNFAKANAVNVDELRARIDEVVPTKDRAGLGNVQGDRLVVPMTTTSGTMVEDVVELRCSRTVSNNIS